jgi:hypothetical protein
MLSRVTSCTILAVLSSLVSCVNGRRNDGDELTRFLHPWDAIEFPDIPLHIGDSQVMIKGIFLGKETSCGDGLRFGFLVDNPSDPMSEDLPEFFASLRVSLHTPAMASLPLPETANFPRREKGPWRDHSDNPNQWFFAYLLPRVGGPLDDTWIELRFGELTCRLELPYGFCGATGQKPKLFGRASARQPSSQWGEKPKISRSVPWQAVDYSLDQGLGGWRTSVEFGHGPVGKCSLWVYAPKDDDGDMLPGQVLTRWIPTTAVSVTDSDGTTQAGEVVPSSIPPGVRGRRCDMVRFPLYAREGRAWGKLTVRVGDKASSITIPSSLYRQAAH